MKPLFMLYCLSFLLVAFATDMRDLNEIRGKITLSDCPQNFTKGSGYNKDGTEIMHSDDPRAKPEMNVIIILYPQDFKPELTLTENSYITQKEQTFIPNILPVVVGSSVHFLNEDEFFHNVLVE